jgi:hypothetical protein
MRAGIQSLPDHIPEPERGRPHRVARRTESLHTAYLGQFDDGSAAAPGVAGTHRFAFRAEAVHLDSRESGGFKDVERPVAAVGHRHLPQQHRGPARRFEATAQTLRHLQRG